jgi:large repetitive protein
MHFNTITISLSPKLIFIYMCYVFNMKTILFLIFYLSIGYSFTAAQSTNAEQSTPSTITFRRSLLRFGTHPSVEAGTFLQFGPDQRLYTLDLSGTVKAYRITKKGHLYKVVDSEVLTGAQQQPNHDDNGRSNPRAHNRVATSLAVGGTAVNPVIYVGTTDPRTGGPNGDKNIDTNSGVITSIRWDGKQWQVLDLVRGLPRSEEYHGLNGMELANIQGKNYLLLNAGGNTNAGAPSKNFAYLCEVALSAAILAIDLDKLAQMPVLKDSISGRQYVYDVPTLDDPTRPNQNGIEDPAVPGYNGKDLGDPWGGNDGLNQGMLTLDV